MASNIPIIDEWFNYDPSEAIEFGDGFVLLDPALKKDCEPYKKDERFKVVIVDYSKSYVDFYRESDRRSITLNIHGQS